MASLLYLGIALVFSFVGFLMTIWLGQECGKENPTDQVKSATYASLALLGIAVLAWTTFGYHLAGWQR